MAICQNQRICPNGLGSPPSGSLTRWMGVLPDWIMHYDLEPFPEFSPHRPTHRIVHVVPRHYSRGVNSSSDKASSRSRWFHSQDFCYGVQGLAHDDLIRLVTEASNSPRMVTGEAPIIDKRRQRKRLPGVAAEALAWGQGLNRQVIVFYYP